MDMEARDSDTQATAEPATLAERRRAFGAELRAEREHRGHTLAGLAQTTRINPNFLEALESGAFEKLPGAVFGRGFIRSVMKSFGADPTALLTAFDALWPTTPFKSVLEVEIKSRPVNVRRRQLARNLASVRSVVLKGLPHGIILPLAGAVVAVCLITAGLRATGHMGWMRHLSAGRAAMHQGPAKVLVVKPEPQSVATATPQVMAAAVAKSSTDNASVHPATTPASDPKTAAVAPADHATQAPAADGNQLLELAVTAPVRVRVQVDGAKSVVKMLAPDTYKFSFAQHAKLLIYDASALKISFNGQPLGSLGGKGRVRRLSFEAASPSSKKL